MRMSTGIAARWSCVWCRSMWVTPRDLEILARVRDARACDSATFTDLFPTVRSLRQRLWRFALERVPKNHPNGNKRAHLLDRRSVPIPGFPAKRVRGLAV